VKDDTVMNELSEEEMKKADQLRIGTRKGMMWSGRERLAESAYESAKREMAKEHPNRNTALWHLNSATNLNPKFLEAIEMKQQLTGREVTTSDNSSVRYFVRKAVLEDVNAAPTTRPSTRPADVTVSQGPATRPAVAAAPATQPAAFDAQVADASPSTQPVAGLEGYAEEVAEEVAAGPTTQPSTVTELPTEEVEGNVPVEFQSK
jgi:hypothetical protein